jgi:hypothetical protein
LHAFLSACGQKRNAERLLKGAKNAAGSRLFPPRYARTDQKFGYRIDQGAYNGDGTYRIVIQENGRPHGENLAATLVDPSVDSGEDVIMRLYENAKEKGKI